MRVAIVIVAMLLCGACGVDTAEDVDDIACSPNSRGESECAPPPPTGSCSDVGALSFNLVCPEASFAVYTQTANGVTTVGSVLSMPFGLPLAVTATASTHVSSSTCAMDVSWGNYHAALTGVERSGTFGGWGASGIWGCTVSLRSRGYPPSGLAHGSM